jgi:serine/threonine protein kinase
MPFQDDPMFDEMQNVMLGRYAFEPSEHWSQISDEAKDFIRTCLSPDPRDRPSARDALRHPWLNRTPATHADALLHSTTELHHAHPSTDLLPALSKTFSPKRRFRRVVHTVRMLNRLNLGHAEYADRMTKAGRYGMDSFSSDGNSNSNEGLRRGSMFTLGVGTQATERTLTPQDGVRHHVRGKSGSMIERTLTN